jgi:hypothetical protein
MPLLYEELPSRLLKKSRLTLLWQRMAPPHIGRSITCDFCGAGPCPAKDFFSILLGWRKAVLGVSIYG